MRRGDREVVGEDRIRQILDKGGVVRIAFNDGDFPYIVPMNYGYDLSEGRLVLFTHGALEGRKVDLARRNPNVGFEIDCEVASLSGGDNPCRYSAHYSSIIGFGRLSVLEDPADKIAGLKCLMKTQTGRDFSFTEQMARPVSVFRLDCAGFTAKSRQP